MTTEIRFLLDLVLEHKLPPEAKRLCLERIGEVEASLQRPSHAPVIHQAPRIVGQVEQAPSTQRLLEAHPPTINIAPQAPAVPNTQRIVGGEISTGNGTKGPRKF